MTTNPRPRRSTRQPVAIQRRKLATRAATQAKARLKKEQKP